MSSTSSQASAASLSDLSGPGCNPLPSAKATPLHEPSLPHAGASEDTRRHQTQSTQTSKTSEAASMSSQQASPAMMSVLPGEARDSTESNPAYGGRQLEPLTKFDPATSSWKTVQPSFLADLDEFSAPWPRSGMMQSGTAYRLPTLAPAISETEYGSSVIDPTPRAQGSSNAGGSNAKKTALKNGVYVTGRMNPAHQEWLMGFPIGHTEIEFSATPSSRKSRKSSGGQS